MPRDLSSSIISQYFQASIQKPRIRSDGRIVNIMVYSFLFSAVLFHCCANRICAHLRRSFAVQFVHSFSITRPCSSCLCYSFASPCLSLSLLCHCRAVPYVSSLLLFVAILFRAFPLLVAASSRLSTAFLLDALLFRCRSCLCLAIAILFFFFFSHCLSGLLIAVHCKSFPLLCHVLPRCVSPFHCYASLFRAFPFHCRAMPCYSIALPCSTVPRSTFPLQNIKGAICRFLQTAPFDYGNITLHRVPPIRSVPYRNSATDQFRDTFHS